MPAPLTASTHWSASSSVGLKSFGSSVPSPHSRSVKVFMPKWTKAWNSSSCQATCRGYGTTRAAFASSCAIESFGPILTGPGAGAFGPPHPARAKTTTAVAADIPIIFGILFLMASPLP